MYTTKDLSLQKYKVITLRRFNLRRIYPSYRLRQLKLYRQLRYSITRLLAENTYYAINFPMANTKCTITK